MYWLFGGSFATIPGFLAGALASSLAIFLSNGAGTATILGGVFGGLAGEAIHHYVRARRGAH